MFERENSSSTEDILTSIHVCARPREKGAAGQGRQAGGCLHPDNSLLLEFDLEIFDVSENMQAYRVRSTFTSAMLFLALSKQGSISTESVELFADFSKE